jgi:hypothetical protein
MAFDINALAWHRVIRISGFHTSTDAMLWSLTQVRDLSLAVSVDNELVINDAMGSPIMKFEQGKSCALSGTNAIFDLGLLSAQNGTSKVLSSTTSFTGYANEIVTVPASGTITLKHTPAAAAAAGIPFIYKLRGDDGHSTTYSYASAASATEFTFTGTTLTPPTGLPAGTRLLVPYYYTADGSDEAVKIVATAKDFTTACRIVVELLAHDPCSPSSKHYAMIIFPNGRLSSAYDLSMASDAGHPFEIEAMQDYCDAEKKLYEFIVPEDISA